MSDTTAEGMLDGHAVTINAADPDSPVVALRMVGSGSGKGWGCRVREAGSGARGSVVNRAGTLRRGHRRGDCA